MNIVRWVSCLIVAALSFALAVLPAEAAFGDCNNAAYLAEFDPRLSRETDFLCTERLRVAVATAGGERHMRLVHHLVADWATTGDVLRVFDQGLRDVRTALGKIGPFQMNDVTVLLLDSTPPLEGRAERFGEIAALTNLTKGGECHIVVYLLGVGATRAYAASVMAHEIFHCVQVASQSAAQMATGAMGRGRSGDWWIEGSADWFATLATAPPDYLDDRLSAFDRDSGSMPLFDMSYQSVVFFEWLGGARGPGAVLPFLSRMAAVRDRAAQMSAMRAALTPAAWLQFAQAYLDKQIHYPGGRALDLHPTDGPGEIWTATRAARLDAAPFVIARGTLDFSCGRWQTAAVPATALAAQREGSTWGTLPAELRGEAGRETRFRYAIFNAADDSRQLTLTGTLAVACAQCMTSQARNSCMVGLWEFESGGRLEWVRRHMPPGLHVSNRTEKGQTMTFNDDGSFSLGAYRGQTKVANDRGVRGTGNVSSHARGRWATSGNALYLCRDMHNVGGTINVQGPGGVNRTVRVPVEAATTLRWNYNCAGNALKTEESVAGADPIKTTYRRRSP